MSPTFSPSRRHLFTGLIGAGLALSGSAYAAGKYLGEHATDAEAAPDEGAPWPQLPARAQQALEHLLQGNRRFRTGHSQHPHLSASWRDSLVAGQHPESSIIGCVDSRVPEEIVTDQGLGDVFTIRSAGHVLDGAVLGSLEYGLEEVKIPLLMVLGHQNCGAVQTAISVLDAGERAPGSLQILVEGLRPAVEATRSVTDPVRRAEATAKRHTRLTVDGILAKSEIIATAVREGNLGLVGAYYDLRTGAIIPV